MLVFTHYLKSWNTSRVLSKATCSANRSAENNVEYLIAEYMVNPKIFAACIFVHYFVRPLRTTNASTETEYQNIPRVS